MHVIPRCNKAYCDGPATNPGAPYLARFSRDVGGDRWSTLYNLNGYQSQCSGIPHLAKNERDAPNFLHAALDKSACAPFLKERRMKWDGTHETSQEIGDMGTRVRNRSRFLTPLRDPGWIRHTTYTM